MRSFKEWSSFEFSLVLVLCVGFCFPALGSSQCEDIFAKSFYAKLTHDRQTSEALMKMEDFTYKVHPPSIDDAIGSELTREYEKDPDQFLSLMRKKLNTQRAEEEVLLTIRYMQNPPLEVFQLLIEMLEKNLLISRDIKYAYAVFMETEIEYESVLLWLKDRMEKIDNGIITDQHEGIYVRQVLEEQNRKRLRKLPRKDRPALLFKPR